MTDVRPSIAELQRATPAGLPWQSGATLEILRAGPVLLEIAAAALAVDSTRAAMYTDPGPALDKSSRLKLLEAYELALHRFMEAKSKVRE